MRQALINENADLFAKNHRYVMRITGSDAEGQEQLDNFIDPESNYPVLVTSSRPLSTGVGDYSGTQTPTASLKGLRVYLAEGDAPPVEARPPPSPRKYWTGKASPNGRRSSALCQRTTETVPHVSPWLPRATNRARMPPGALEESLPIC